MAFLNCSGTFSWGVEATKVKLSSGQVILMAKLKRHNTHGYDDITQTCERAAKISGRLYFKIMLRIKGEITEDVQRLFNK